MRVAYSTDLRGVLKVSLLIVMTEFLCCWENDRPLQKNPVKENQLSWSKVQIKGLVGEDAIVLSVQCFAALHELTNSYHLNTIQKLELFSHHTPSSAAFKPRKFSLCIHSVQACCIDALV